MKASQIVRLLVLALLTASIIHFTLRKDEQPEPAPELGNKDIFDFIEDGDTTGFVHWIEQSPDLNQQNEQGHTPLIHAVIHNRLAYAIDLVGHGADKDARDIPGSTALHRAAERGYTPLVALLIESGADTGALNREGLTAYDLAVLSNHAATATALLEAREIPEIVDTSTEVQPEHPEQGEITPAALLSTDFRMWTSAGGEKIDAAFIQNIFDTVILQRRDGNFFRIPLIRLSATDQVAVRELSGMDPHVLARARASRAPAPAKRAENSLGLDLKDKDGWTVLEGCRLIKSGANDGDSFHVEHDGEEYIFRLYFVDAAETKMTYPERVRDQAEYFNLSRDDTVELGEAAARFTTSLLAGGTFTVATRWEDAKGNSRLPRYFALVITSQGDLDELLVEEGLVRRYGMSVSGSLGQKKQSRLKQLEGKAKNERNGAWGKRS